MSRYLYFLPGWFPILFLAVIPAKSQTPVLWQDIHAGDWQHPVYVAPPSEFYSGIRTASFDVNYTGFSPDATTAFEFAAGIWGSLLNSAVPIKVNAFFVPLLPGLLGITLPNGVKDFQGALSSTWYATALANSITGNEENEGEYDFDLYLNSGINWYYGTDGNCPAGQYDLVSIALHEMCHGLGFVGLSKVVSNTGSFGLLQASDFAPIVTSFPWPDLDTLPSIFDSKVVESDGNLLISYPNPSPELKTHFTGNQLYFEGEYATQMNNGIQPRMYAPSSFALGSSLVHLNESTYPAGNINELMTPFAGASNAVHDPGPIVMGILQDIGWSVNYAVGVNHIPEASKSLHLFPNPAASAIWLESIHSDQGTFSITNALGQSVIRLDYLPAYLDIHWLTEGIYMIRWNDGSVAEAITFLKIRP